MFHQSGPPKKVSIKVAMSFVSVAQPRPPANVVHSCHALGQKSSTLFHCCSPFHTCPCTVGIVVLYTLSGLSRRTTCNRMCLGSERHANHRSVWQRL